LLEKLTDCKQQNWTILYYLLEASVFYLTLKFYFLPQQPWTLLALSVHFMEFLNSKNRRYMLLVLLNLFSEKTGMNWVKVSSIVPVPTHNPRQYLRCSGIPTTEMVVVVDLYVYLSYIESHPLSPFTRIFLSVVHSTFLHSAHSIIIIIIISWFVDHCCNLMHSCIQEWKKIPFLYSKVHRLYTISIIQMKCFFCFLWSKLYCVVMQSTEHNNNNNIMMVVVATIHSCEALTDMYTSHLQVKPNRISMVKQYSFNRTRKNGNTLFLPCLSNNRVGVSILHNEKKNVSRYELCYGTFLTNMYLGMKN